MAMHHNLHHYVPRLRDRECRDHTAMGMALDGFPIYGDKDIAAATSHAKSRLLRHRAHIHTIPSQLVFTIRQSTTTERLPAKKGTSLDIQLPVHH